MRILIVHNLLWAHYKASVFQALQRLADARAGTVVRVLQIARNERARAGMENTDVTPPDAPAYAYAHELLFDRYWDEVGTGERTRALLRRLRAFRPNVLILTGYYDPAQLALLLWAKATGIRVILQHESTAADHARGGPKEWLKRRIVGLCDGFFCFGNQSADYLIQLGADPGRILVRRNAVDNDTLRRAYERARPDRTAGQQRLGLRPRNFVFVGRLVAAKNLPALLTAFAEARAQLPGATDWGLVLLGDGPERSTLRARADALGLTGDVHLLAGRPWYRVPDVLALADVLVLPSRSEPWGLVVNEAMACGLPVIVSNRCGCASELVGDGENGYVFDPDRPAELTRCLLGFMTGEADRARMGQASARRIAPYAPDAVAAEMLAGCMKIGA